MSNMEASTHTINVKGNFSNIFKDAQLGKNVQDVSYGYNKILFVGTDEELDKYLDYLIENEGKFGFKII